MFQKKILKKSLIFVAVLFIGFWLINLSKASVTTDVEAFLDALSEGDLEASSAQFHKGVEPSKTEFQQFVTTHNLLDIQSYKITGKATGKSRYKGRYSLIKTKIETAADDELTLAIEFRKLEDDWKIHRLYPVTTENEDMSLSELVAPTPVAHEIRKLVDESVVIFGDGLRERDMASFSSHTSNLWQSQVTGKELMAAFSVFPKQTGVALRSVIERNVSISLTESPAIDDDGVLHVKYFYLTKPKRVHFEHKYVYEGLSWKLIGFKMEIPKGKPKVEHEATKAI